MSIANLLRLEKAVPDPGWRLQLLLLLICRHRLDWSWGGCSRCGRRDSDTGSRIQQMMWVSERINAAHGSETATSSGATEAGKTRRLVQKSRHGDVTLRVRRRSMLIREVRCGRRPSIAMSLQAAVPRRRTELAF